MQIMRIMAKDLIATRNNQKRFIQMQAQLQSICLRITTLRATADMTSAMSGVTKAMKMMNEETNIYQLKELEFFFFLPFKPSSIHNNKQHTAQ